MLSGCPEVDVWSWPHSCVRTTEMCVCVPRNIAPVRQFRKVLNQTSGCAMLRKRGCKTYSRGIAGLRLQSEVSFRIMKMLSRTSWSFEVRAIPVRFCMSQRLAKYHMKGSVLGLKGPKAREGLGSRRTNAWIWTSSTIRFLLTVSFGDSVSVKFITPGCRSFVGKWYRHWQHPAT